MSAMETRSPRLVSVSVRRRVFSWGRRIRRSALILALSSLRHSAWLAACNSSSVGSPSSIASSWGASTYKRGVGLKREYRRVGAEDTQCHSTGPMGPNTAISAIHQHAFHSWFETAKTGSQFYKQNIDSNNNYQHLETPVVVELTVSPSRSAILIISGWLVWSRCWPHGAHCTLGIPMHQTIEIPRASQHPPCLA
jgi:hypothetical protein